MWQGYFVLSFNASVKRDIYRVGKDSLGVGIPVLWVSLCRLGGQGECGMEMVFMDMGMIGYDLMGIGFSFAFLHVFELPAPFYIYIDKSIDLQKKKETPVPSFGEVVL